MKNKIITHTFGAVCFAIASIIFAYIILNQGSPATGMQIFWLAFYISAFWIEAFILWGIEEKKP